MRLSYAYKKLRSSSKVNKIRSSSIFGHPVGFKNGFFSLFYFYIVAWYEKRGTQTDDVHGQSSNQYAKMMIWPKKSNFSCTEQLKK